MAGENNLPLALSTFVGREREITEVKRLLSATRLLTLHGPGGCGKTRLALRVAGDCADGYPDGLRLLELAPLSDAELLPDALAATLEVVQQPGRSLLEALVERLQVSRTLIILDNCEHLVLACARLAETLLAACPDLHILATSREVLDVPGELAWLVPSLSVPDPGAPPLNVASSLDYEAVRLFVERAAAIAPAFALTERNAAAVVQICRQLDGIPLAIELAAARVKVLPVEEIAMRLDRRFDLLRGGSRTAPPRQQTLRAALDWSYRLLSAPEQALLRRLSVFAGGWTLAAAVVAAGRPSSGPAAVEAQYDILDLLARLVNKSLVVTQTLQETGSVRYSMLETVRQYAWDRAGEAGEQHDLKERHLSYFLRLAEETEPALHGPLQTASLDRLEADNDNLRAALRWGIDREEGLATGAHLSPAETASHGDIPAGLSNELPESALRLAGALLWFWWIRGHPGEGRRWLEEALAHGAEASAPRRARALFCAGYFATFQGDYQQALAQCEESLNLFRSLADRRGMAWAQFIIAMVMADLDEPSRASALLEESLALWREAGDREGLGFALHLLGEIADDEGDHERAQSLFRESLGLWREQGNMWAVALSLTNHAEAAQLQHDYASARAYAAEGMALSDQLHDRRHHAIFHQLLGEVARKTGDFDGARLEYAEALALFRAIGDRWYIARGLEGAALLACGRMTWEVAARLFGAAATLRAAIKAPLPLVYRGDLELGRKAAAAALGKAAFEASWSAGCALSVDQAIALAAAEPEPARAGQPPAPAFAPDSARGLPPQPGKPSPRWVARMQYDGLTVREREVAALVAQGKSNHEIAEALVISDRTAAVHVGNILAKLDFTSRAQIAAWAVSKGLAQ